MCNITQIPAIPIRSNQLRSAVPNVFCVEQLVAVLTGGGPPIGRHYVARVRHNRIASLTHGSGNYNPCNKMPPVGGLVPRLRGTAPNAPPAIEQLRPRNSQRRHASEIPDVGRAERARLREGTSVGPFHRATARSAVKFFTFMERLA